MDGLFDSLHSVLWNGAKPPTTRATPFFQETYSPESQRKKKMFATTILN